MENAFGVSPFALNFIKKLEGYTPKPKWDFKQFSTGYGTRWEPGQPLGTRADHEAALAGEAGKVGSWLDQNAKAPMTENQRAALISAGFNLGTGEKGLGRLLGDIQSGNWDSIARRLPSFNKAGGQVNEGLINRRAAEVEMLTGRKPTQQELMASGYIGGTAATPSAGPAPMPAQLPEQPSARKSKLADMLMAKALSSRPQGWGDALNSLTAAFVGSQIGSKHDDAEKGYRSKLAEALMGAKDTDALTSTLLSSGDPELQKSAIGLKVAQMKPNAPLRGKERYMATPNGVMDVETQQIVPGTERKAAGDNAPAGYRPAQDGNLEFIPGGPADPATNNRQVKYNEGQTKAANFGRMMTEAEKLVGDQANPLSFWGQLRENIAPEAVNNQMRSPEQQAYRQAADQWIRAKLRKESGATITPEESEGEFRTFFPAPGDSPEVIAQKKLARQQAIQGMIAESGGAYGSLFPDQPAPAAQPPAPGATPGTAPASKPMTAPRPQGVSDEQIMQEANKAMREGKDPAAVRQQLEAWGIRF